ncbi:IclR family transcriptional regulator [Cupriavidus sp. USMAA2-4]|uniref:IclR family transcriptional regulator n=1 Tax=Cupriavidus malaysiensis TaxID=367825 RepID=A0ABM6FB25_9BURK|nr:MULTISPECIES: helix-turn-helix domain-containing protein [Cupriavidus]AOY95701.1 IclR family transcriptional regulator [Cupriavidus sp. USMAA2-4]AOZ01426.1 IclR family transcriptional regulator [Cupriavidus sp. USMAHM13]AOZ08851.1 IclR family transcriptional regulator [Cupriavidus malaysiensis]
MNTPVEQFIAERRLEDPSFGGLLAKGFALLRCFIDEPQPLGNGELAQRLQLPRATVSRICRTLFELGYLDWDPKLDKYFVSAQVLALGYPYLAGLQVRHLARPLMQALADRVEGAVSMGVAHRLDVTYLLSCTHNEGTPAKPGVGAVRSVMRTAMGRAFLCTLSKQEFGKLMASAKAERPEEYEACYDRVCHNVAHYPKRGFAINEGDAGSGVHGAGVYSRIVYLNRPLLFNCALAGSQLRRGTLERRIAPMLMEMVRAVEAAAGLQR